MDRAKGIAFCGLACAVCSENVACVGCRDGGCTGKEWCKNLSCCKRKRLSGCWECDEFPCTGTMLDKPRIHAFARLAREYGEGVLLDRLEINERAGLVYHYPGCLTGDYDVPATEEGIIDLVMHGRRCKD